MTATLSLGHLGCASTLNVHGDLIGLHSALQPCIDGAHGSSRGYGGCASWPGRHCGLGSRVGGEHAVARSPGAPPLLGPAAVTICCHLPKLVDTVS